MVAQQVKAVCGIYPPAVADAMLATAQERIKYAYEAIAWHFAGPDRSGDRSAAAR